MCCAFVEEERAILGIKENGCNENVRRENKREVIALWMETNVTTLA